MASGPVAGGGGGREGGGGRISNFISLDGEIFQI